jgi:hypothetical protein
MQRRDGHRLKDVPSHQENVCADRIEARREQQSEVEVHRGIGRKVGFVASGSLSV